MEKKREKGEVRWRREGRREKGKGREKGKTKEEKQKIETEKIGIKKRKKKNKIEKTSACSGSIYLTGKKCVSKIPCYWDRASLSIRLVQWKMYLFEKPSIRKFEKQFTISSLLKKKFIWPDKTNQDHSGDLMDQSAMCQNWLMCPFRNLRGDLIPTSTDKSSPEDPIANTSCEKKKKIQSTVSYFALELREVILSFFFFFFSVQPLCFDLIWIVLSWPKNVIYDKT